MQRLTGCCFTENKQGIFGASRLYADPLIQAVLIRMSYETRVDEMVGKHVAQFQDEMILAKIMGRYAKKAPSMPYGYPIAVYCPLHTCRTPVDLAPKRTDRFSVSRIGLIETN